MTTAQTKKAGDTKQTNPRKSRGNKNLPTDWDKQNQYKHKKMPSRTQKVRELSDQKIAAST